MAVTEQIVRQPEFIEQRTEQLLQSVFGPQGVANTAMTVPQAQVATFQPLQNTAMSMAQSGLGAYQPYLQQASNTQVMAANTALGGTQAYNPSSVSLFMDPYQQQVTQQALAEMDRQAAIAQQQASAQAVAAGSFGGDREGVVRSELARNLQDIKSRRIFEDLSRNYLQAQQTGLAAQQAQQQRQLQAAGILGGVGAQQLGLGQFAQQAGVTDVNQLLGLGGMQQAQEQAQMDVARQNILEAQREPFGRIQFASDILRGVPSGQSTFITQPSPSPLSQLLGAGVSLAGISSLMGGGSGIQL